MRRFALVLTSLLALATAGCSPTITSRISAFSADDFDVASRTFAIAPSSGQARSLQFETYARHLQDRLGERGLAFAGPRARPDTMISMAYSVDGGRSFTEIVPIYAPVGGGHVFRQGVAWGPWGPRPFTSVGYVPPRMAVVGAEPIQRTVFTRQLRLRFTDARTGRVLHERTAVSQGGRGSFEEVALCMIDAAADGFPGPSGLTRVVEVPAERCIAG